MSTHQVIYYKIETRTFEFTNPQLPIPDGVKRFDLLSYGKENGAWDTLKILNEITGFGLEYANDEDKVVRNHPEQKEYLIAQVFAPRCQKLVWAFGAVSEEGYWFALSDLISKLFQLHEEKTE